MTHQDCLVHFDIVLQATYDRNQCHREPETDYMFFKFNQTNTGKSLRVKPLLNDYNLTLLAVLVK